MDPWRLILDPPLSGAENMAVDEAVLRTMEAYVEDGVVQQMPTLRIYSWLAPIVSIGYMQNAKPFIKSSSGDGAPVPLVRRITGGRAVLHDSEITYSLVCPSSHQVFKTGIEEGYRVVSSAIAGALRDAGVEASFERGSLKRGRSDKDACFLTTSRYEVVVGKEGAKPGGKKIAGSSQRRFKGALLQHGSILLEIDKDLTERVFSEEVADSIASVSDFTEVTPESIDLLKGALIERLAESLNAEFFLSKLPAPEYNLMQELKEGKYLTKEWNEHNSG